MRLSTVQIFQQGLSAIQEQQARLDKTQQQLSTGKRVLSPADDPTAAVQALGIRSELERVDQYQRNSNLAQGQLALEESTLAQAGNVLQRVRELVVQANNASQSPETRRGIATEVAARIDELQSIANTRDANGEYIFAGYNAKSQPFNLTGGTVTFTGDGGQRFLQLGASTQVAVRDSGAEVFMRVREGNGTFAVEADGANAGTAVAGKSSTTGAFVRDTYTVTFTQATPADPVTYQVEDSGANVVASGNYNSGDALSFNGASVRFDGTPADGDRFTVAASSNQDMFSTLQGIVDVLNDSTGAPADVAQLNTSLGQSLETLDQSLDHLLQIRADVGVRQQQVDSQIEINESFNLQLQETLSGIEDLDYAEAISRFNLELTALQAAQQTFVKAQGLSLFNYL